MNEIAERIGGKVRGLDEELLRVREAGERLNEVMELKVSLEASRGREGRRCELTSFLLLRRACRPRWKPYEAGFGPRIGRLLLELVNELSMCRRK